MRKQLAQELDTILESGNFKSVVVQDVKCSISDKVYKYGLKIMHDEVSTELALQHIQEHINEDLDNDCDWSDEYEMENINQLTLVEQNEKYSIYV